MKRREIHGLLWCALGVLAVAALPAPGSAQTGVVDGCLSSSSCFAGAIDADAITDINGQTAISGAITAGGCDTALNVVCQGTQFLQGPTCVALECHPIAVRSPDVIDFSIFGAHFLHSCQ